MDRLQKILLEEAYWRRERLKLTHPLTQLFWECTLRCNLACRHCGSDCLAVADAPDMPLADFLPVLDSVKAHQPKQRVGVWTVGGEPLVRKDIIECGRAITEKGFVWGTVSNAMLLDGPMLRELLSAGLRTIAIDIDGLRDQHTWLRQSPISFDRAYEAIGHLRRTPRLMWDIITCVHPGNIDQLPELRKMLVEAGVKKWRCFTIVPMGRAKDGDMSLNPEQMRRLMDFIAETRSQGQISLAYSCEGFLGDYEGLARGYIYTCIAGLNVASVRANGDISGCLSIRSQYSQGNIYRDDFWDVWQNRFEIYRNREWMRKGECADCEMWRNCEGNGFHLRDDDGNLMLCHHHKLQNAKCQ